VALGRSFGSFGPNGNFVVTWESYFQDGSEYGIYGQLFDGLGNTFGSEFQVNTYTTSSQQDPSVATFSNGDFVVTWESFGQDGSRFGIYSQLFDGSRNKLGSEFQVNTVTANDQQNPSVATFPNSNFVVTWESSGQDGSGYGVYGQLFNATGNPVDNEFQVNTYTAGGQQNPSVTAFFNGIFMVVWESSLQDGGGYGIYARLFNFNNNVVILNTKILHFYTEDSNYNFNVKSIVIDQFINPNVTVKLTLPDPMVGALTATSVGTALATCNPLTGTCQATGLVNDMNAVWDTLQYQPAMNYNQNFTIAIWASDGIAGNFTGNLFMNGIPINDLPVLVNNTLTLNQGDRVILDPTHLFAFDIDNKNATLQFQSINIQQGRFEELSNPGNPINTFFQQQITNRAIQFVHDDSVNTPSYDIQVSNGKNISSISPAIINFNLKPIIENNILSINQNGETVILTPSNLKASDVDDADTTLRFTVSDIIHGRFELVGASGTNISSFIQQAILDSEVQFVHDGNRKKSAYDVIVSDGKLNSTTEPAIINFFAGGNSTVINPPRGQDLNAKPTNLVLPVVGIIAGFSIGLMAGIGFWRYRTQRAKKQYRNQYPLANALYEKLHLTDVVDFYSKAGQEFISTVNQLKGLFSDRGYDAENMAADTMDDFATYVANAIRLHVTLEKAGFSRQTLDMAEVKSKADRIVNSVQTVIEQDGWVPRQGPVMEKFAL